MQTAVQGAGWTLRWWPSARAQPRSQALIGTSALRLQRCGSHHATELSAHEFISPILTRRYAAWVKGRVLHRWDLRSGLEISQRLPRSPSGLHYTLSGTSERVAVAVPGSGQATRVYEFR
jgi:hypothetical protein